MKINFLHLSGSEMLEVHLQTRVEYYAGMQFNIVGDVRKRLRSKSMVSACRINVSNIAKFVIPRAESNDLTIYDSEACRTGRMKMQAEHCVKVSSFVEEVC